MNGRCPECGAPVPPGRSCRDHFHALLLLEGEIPGVPGSILHFFIVATYVLQHPGSMGYTAEAVSGLLPMVAEALDGRLSLEECRRRARRAADGEARVLRRPGEAAVSGHPVAWTMTIADVCTEETFGSIATYEELDDRVRRWARSVCEALEPR